VTLGNESSLQRTPGLLLEPLHHHSPDAQPESVVVCQVSIKDHKQSAIFEPLENFIPLIGEIMLECTRCTTQHLSACDTHW
jgi:hypothetical protein